MKNGINNKGSAYMSDDTKKALSTIASRFRPELLEMSISHK